MLPKCSSTTADILYFLADGKIHTLTEIAEYAEVSWRTAQSHVQSLSYRYPIETYRGGRNTGGVKLDTNYIVQGKILSIQKLKTINIALDLLQESKAYNVDQQVLTELRQDFPLPVRKGEDKN